MSKLRLPPNPRFPKPPTPQGSTRIQISPVASQIGPSQASHRPILQLRSCVMAGNERQSRSQEPPIERGEVKVGDDRPRKVHISNRVLLTKPLTLETWVRPLDSGAQTQRNAEASERTALRSSLSQPDIPETKVSESTLIRPHRPAEPKPTVGFRRPAQRHTPKSQSIEDQKQPVCICNQ